MQSFQLDKRSGKKCYMLASRDLSIGYSDSPLYWNWTTLPESRFEEVAKLVGICCLEIHGRISSRLLSLKTHYSAYLVFKIIDGFCVGHHPAEVSVGIVGVYSSTRNVYLDLTMTDEQRRHLGLPCPEVRNDGWLEIKMGDFFNLGVEDDQVNMSVVNKEAGIWKTSLVLQVIEVRPRKEN
ncbi:hypothetical protein L6164_002098 [Bauhinia variegata]|uniref:Uncharacterized protein n=1 Tax=Bauhinia variegata TaxID=167791 RepID=A0ACB9PWL8_BAUVA|nr:hypothetical protein L6164_002098 [Bauhinia variegata]